MGRNHTPRGSISLYFYQSIPVSYYSRGSTSSRLGQCGWRIL
jgi:hypothetical protein